MFKLMLPLPNQQKRKQKKEREKTIYSAILHWTCWRNLVKILCCVRVSKYLIIQLRASLQDSGAWLALGSVPGPQAGAFCCQPCLFNPARSPPCKCQFSCSIYIGDWEVFHCKGYSSA